MNHALVEAPFSFLGLGLFNSVMSVPCIRAKCGFPAAQANQREPARSQFRGKVSRLARKSLSGRERGTTPEERASSPSRKTLRSGEGLDLIKAEIIYKDYGIAVGADSSLEPTRDRRAVRILIEVYKQ